MSVFLSGELVFHRNYKYRGVVFKVDQHFNGSDSWYNSNKTQPDKGQPWYHVLVHGSDVTTYVAESNLEADSSLQPIEHPLIKSLFDDLFEGKYVLRKDG